MLCANQATTYLWKPPPHLEMWWSNDCLSWLLCWLESLIGSPSQSSQAPVWLGKPRSGQEKAQTSLISAVLEENLSWHSLDGQSGLWRCQNVQCTLQKRQNLTHPCQPFIFHLQHNTDWRLVGTPWRPGLFPVMSKRGIINSSPLSCEVLLSKVNQQAANQSQTCSIDPRSVTGNIVLCSLFPCSNFKNTIKYIGQGGNKAKQTWGKVDLWPRLLHMPDVGIVFICMKLFLGLASNIMQSYLYELSLQKHCKGFTLPCLNILPSAVLEGISLQYSPSIVNANVPVNLER